MAEEHRTGYTGPILGILTFAGGVALLAFTFKLAIDLFGTDPARLFDLQPGQTLDLSKAGVTLMGVIVKILLLLVMAIVSGVIANRGIKLYADSRHSAVPRRVKEKGSEPTES